MSKETQPYLIGEMNIKLGEGIDTAFACNIPVLVEFEYEPGYEGTFGGSMEDAEPSEPPYVSVKRVTIGAESVALEGERTTLTFHQGCCVLAYLEQDVIDQIAEAMCDRMDEEAKDSAGDAAIDNYEYQRHYG